MDQATPQEATAAAPPPPMPTSVPQVQAPPYHLICLDRSKDFSTVHGDRHPSDPHYRSVTCQNGLYFDANDHLLPDDGRTEPFKGMNMEGKETLYFPLYNNDMRRLVARRLERLMRHGSSLMPEPERVADPDESLPDTDLVNLTMWLKGEVEYPDNLVCRAVRERHFKTVRSTKEAVDFLAYELKPPLIHPRLIHQKRMALLNRQQ